MKLYSWVYLKILVYVRFFFKEIGHIGKTHDPDWIGASLMALHNNTNKKI